MLNRLILVSVLFATAVNQTVGIEPVFRLSAEDDPLGDNAFGWSVGINGDYVAVGAPWDPRTSGDQFGAVYVFRRVGHRWIQEAKLTGSQSQWQDQLGYSVAIDGSVVVAGTPAWSFDLCDLRREGAVYVFRRNDQGTVDPDDDEWFEEAYLTAPNPEVAIGFGFSVSVSGDRLVAGSDCGESAEVFRFVKGIWVHEASLSRADMDPYQGFGESVSIDGAQAVIGAPGYADRRGAAYPFKFDSGMWSPDGMLLPEAAGGGGFFGRAVGIASNKAIIGSPDGPDGGRAYVFVRESGNWMREKYLIGINDSESHELGNQFGAAVAIDDDVAIVGRRGRPWAYVVDDVGTASSIGRKLSGDTDWSLLSTSLHGRFAIVAGHIYAVRDTTDLHQFADFQVCFGWLGCDCQSLDITNDGDVDDEDFAEFLSTFSGP